MSEAVVDLLEVVEIDGEQRDIASAAACVRQRALEPEREAAPVEAPGGRIRVDQRRELRAELVERRADRGHGVGVRVTLDVVLAAEVALARVLEQRGEHAQPTLAPLMQQEAHRRERDEAAER